MKNRQIIPDWLKGLAIVLMVYGHIIHVGSLATFQLQIVEIISTFHMPLFLVISGFFFNPENEPYETLRKLVSRIVLPYLIFISLHNLGLILIQRIGVSTTNIPPTSFTGFLEIVFLHPNTPHWFLHSIILIQLCLVLSKMIVMQAKLDEPTQVIILILLLAILCNYNFISQATAVYFLLGMILSRFSNKLPISLKTGFILVAVILVTAKNDILSVPFSYTNISLVKVAWSLSIMLFFSGIGNAMERTMIVSIFTWFGRNSLVLLVIHPIFAVMLKPSSTLLLRIDQTGLAYSILVLITTMYGCMFIASFLDKIKMSSYLFGTKSIYSNFQRHPQL
jgi:fucose 4-O-acetylase-like acetyltransferase